MTPTKVFISYAHDDLDWLRLLRQHLGWLENNDQIDAFDDREIMAGEEWDPRIKEKLVKCRCRRTDHLSAFPGLEILHYALASGGDEAPQRG